MAAPPLVSSRLHQILTHLPAASYAFAYGSGVLTQPGLYDAQESQASTQPQTKPTADSQARGPQLDFILAVPDPSAWHAENIRANPSHYSWVTGIAQHIGVGIHFNTLVNISGQLVKYGVVGCDCLEDDLLTWRHLYVAGRLHKPVVHLVGRSQALAMAQAANLRAAAATALLLLPPSFTTQDFLVKLVGLSYLGDVRMGLAEDPHKVIRISQGSRQGLEALYLPLLHSSHSPPSHLALGSVPGPHTTAETPAWRSPQGPDHPDVASPPLPSPSPAPGHAQQPAAASTQLTQGSTPSPPVLSATIASSAPLLGQWRAAAQPPLWDVAGLMAAASTQPASLPWPGGQQAGVAAAQGSRPGLWEAGEGLQWTQATRLDCRHALLQQLPPALLVRVATQLGFQSPESHFSPGSVTLQDVTWAAIKSGEHQQLVARALHNTVRASSLWQAAAGVLASGGEKSVAYVAAKMAKAFRTGAAKLHPAQR